jgi:YidC/Oxa1 family membrane protein insertase
MDTKNIILAVIFSFSLLMLWEAWTNQNQTVMQQEDSLSLNKNATDQANISSSEIPSATVFENNEPSDMAFSPGTASNLNPNLNLIEISNNDLRLLINPKGARIEYAELLTQDSEDYDEGHVILFSNVIGEQYEAQSGIFAFPGGSDVYPNHTTDFVVDSNLSKFPNSVTLVSMINNIKLIKEISLKKDGYEILLNSRVKNNKNTDIDVGIYYQLVRSSNPPRGGSSFYQTYTGPAFYSEKEKFQKVDFEDIAENKAEHVRKSNDGWLGMIQHHYVSAWILNNKNSREFYSRSLPNNLYSVGAIQHLGKIQSGNFVDHSANLYVGPQLQNNLKKLAPGLELVVDYGILTVIAKPIFWLLDKIYSFVGNWGWSIVVLTIIIKLLFYPLTAASYKSMAKMKAVTPRMVKIREQFKGDKMQMNKALMELYQKEKINPLGGCLPVLVQIPVFIALYWVLLGSVEIRNAPWILWITDLSVPDPFYILPLIMAVTMFIQMKLNPTPPDPLQAKIMMMMPVIFSIFFFFFPAGLVLYWLVNNVVSIAQQWSIMRRLNVKI